MAAGMPSKVWNGGKAPCALCLLLLALLTAQLFTVTVSEECVALSTVNKTKVVSKMTLTFVIDITLSMTEELIQVKLAVRNILEYLVKHRGDEIENFVLVQFADPRHALWVDTKDVNTFVEKVRGVKLGLWGQGIDCPEMSMHGLRLAIESSLPYSYIFHFTDAGAKDYFLRAEIESLIQEKKCKIFFVLTGNCYNRKHPADTIFESLAKFSNGHAFRVTRPDVKKVLVYVNDATGRKNTIAAGDLKKNKVTELKISVDTSMKELMVTVTGENTSLVIKDEFGKKIDAKNLLNLKEVASVQVKNPKSGKWKVYLSTKSDGKYVMDADSKFKFEYGFLIDPSNNVSMATSRPVMGKNNKVMVKILYDENNISLKQVKLISESGKELITLKLSSTDKCSEYYLSDKHLFPDKIFILVIIGKDDKGNDVIRQSDSSIQPKKDEPPYFKDPERKTIKARPRDLVLLKCDAQGFPTPAIVWKKDGEIVQDSSETQLKEGNTKLFIKMSPETEGNYECEAKNSAGTASKKFDVNLLEPPYFKFPENKTISAKPKDLVLLKCDALGNPTPTIVWKKDGKTVTNTPETQLRDNNTMLFIRMSSKSTGKYECEAKNPIGAVTKTFDVTTQGPPYFKVPENKTITARPKDILSLKCDAVGTPTPTIVWKKDGEIVENSPETLLKENNTKLFIKMSSETKGKYECEATNPGGSVTKTFDVNMLEPPYFKKPDRKVINARPNDLVLLKCDASGNPKPDIEWKKDGKIITSSPATLLRDDNTKLFINTSMESNGTYECKAKNKAGSTTKNFDLKVGEPPFFKNPDRKAVRAKPDDKVLLKCDVSGNPEPTIVWKKDGEIVTNSYETQLKDGNKKLLIKTTMASHGTYECEATNPAGSAKKTFDLNVEEPPYFKNPDRKVVNAQPGDAVLLKCDASGSPKPDIVWKKDGVIVTDSVSTQLRDGNTKLFIRTNTDSNGTYECVATNSAGTATKLFDLNVQEPPYFKRPEPISINAKPEDLVLLKCDASGSPKPDLVWKKDGVIVKNSSGTQLRDNNEKLYINTTMESEGTYECEATNPVGSATKTFNLNVGQPPYFKKPDPKTVRANPKDLVLLRCDASGSPKPDIVWKKDGKIVTDSASTQLREGNTRLFIRASDDNIGTYECVATNSGGSAKKLFDLNMLEPPYFKNPARKVINAKPGDLILLKCDASGNPKPSIVWRKDGEIVTDTSETLLKDGNTKLYINTTMDSQGTYECEARNSGGSATKIFDLNMQEPPYFKRPNRVNLNAKPKDVVVLKCKASGSPEPTIVWKKDNRIITSSPDVSFQNSTVLLLKTTKDSKGTYECEATNPHGKASKFYDVTIK